jgi:zinc protease
MSRTFTASARPGPGPLRPLPRLSAVSRPLDGGANLIHVRRPGAPIVEIRIGLPLPRKFIAATAVPTVLAESILAGTPDFDRDELALAVQRLGGTLAASADSDALTLSASVVTDNAPALMRLIAHVLTAANYPSAEVASDAQRMADEVAMAATQPGVIAGSHLDALLYPGHPYAAGLPTPDEVRAIRPASLRSAHRTVVTPAGAHVVIVGDLTPRRLDAVIAELAPWLTGTGRAAARLAAPTPTPGGTTLVVDRPGAVQSTMRIARQTEGRDSVKWPARAAANLIYGGLFTSRLIQNLRERNGYSYSPRSLFTHHRSCSQWTLTADVASEATAAALVEARYELGRIVTTGVTESELDMARRYAIGALTVQTATRAGLASMLVDMALTGLDVNYLPRYTGELARLTVADVNEAAVVLSPTSMTTVIVGDAASIADSLSTVTSVTAAN